MDWKREEERAALGRVVALLSALAVLAERAAGRSPLVRNLVLWVLRHAEATARDFIAGGTDSPGAPSASWPVVPAGAGPRDAMRLAAGLRALARQLDRQAGRLSARCGRLGRGAVAPWTPSGAESWADFGATPGVASWFASGAGRMPALRAALATLSRLAGSASGALIPVRAPDTS